MTDLDLVEASIGDLREALSAGLVTSVELVSLYLRRISKYDCRGPLLNGIPVLNPNVFEEAMASDEYRRGHPPRPLEGIPFTVKDSYKVEGLVVAAGSAAFQSLVAGEDAFTVRCLREAGAVLVGRTNMPPMAAGGMQRGVYGRAESPYNLEYLPAAFASGSSNGSATSTAASMAAFGMGEETVSSGRSPASNNGLVAYTPSRGLISIRGNWPLYVTCDVIVPHTRTVADMLDILDVVVAEDEITEGDFWRAQPFVKLPKPSTMRPKSYRELANDGQSLRGKVIGVPKMYIGGDPPQDQDRPVHTRQSVIDLWRQAKKDLEALGAEVREVADFPLVTNYERHAATATHNVPGLPDNWGEAERGIVIAYSWDDFLRANGDPGLPDAWAVDASKIFPRSLDEVQWKWSEMSNLVGYDTLFESWLPRDRRRGKSIFEIPGMREACLALEATRKRDLEDWMDRLGLDLVAFPANGDVGRADADTDDDSARHAWKNGVKYSNGNRALRHLGAPTVSVTMGVMEDTKMPVGLTFVSKAYDDNNLLRYAYAYEQKSRRRIAPPLTPTLDTDCILRPRSAISKKKEEGPGAGRGEVTTTNATKPVELFLSGSRRAGGVPPSEEFVVNLRGKVRVTDGSGITSLTVYVDGEKVDGVEVDHHGDWAVVAQTRVPQVPAHVKTEAAIARDQVMVVVVVETGAGVQAGRLLLL